MDELNTLKIGEFARIAQVSVATLRHYDKMGLLQPVVLDPDTGYRSYSLDQLARLHRLLALKDLGFSLQQIAQLLQGHLSLEQLQGMFALKQAQTQLMIEQEQARLTRIAARLRQIEQEGSMSTYDVLLKQVDALLVASVRDMVPLADGLKTLSEKLVASLQQYQVQPEPPLLVLLHSRSQQRDDNLVLDMEIALPVATSLPANERIIIQTLPSTLMACTIHTGPDLFLGQAYAALYRWMRDHGYQIAGVPRQIRLRYDAHMNSAQYVTEVQFPVIKHAQEHNM